MTHSNVLDDRAARAASHPGTGPVIVALKPFDGGDSAIAMARWLAARVHGELHAMSVIEMGDVGTMDAGLPPLPESYYTQEREEVTEDLRARLAQPDDLPAVRVDVVEGPPGSTVASIADARHASTIVIGTGQHGMFGRFLYGERALDVVRTAASPVLIVPPDADPPLARVVVAVDFSASSIRAATSALEMVGEGGHVTLVHVASASRHPEGRARGVEEECDRRTHARLVQFVDALPRLPGVRLDMVVLRGDAAGALLRHAEEQEAELIACGRSRHSLVQRLLVGSVSTALIRGAPCCVLVAPELDEDHDLHARSQFGETRTNVNPDEWRDLLRDLSDRNAGRRARFSLSPAAADGVESVDRGYQLLTMDYDRRGGRADIVLGDPRVVGSHLTHRIAGVHHIEIVTEPGGRDSRIAFRTGSGDCLLDFVDRRRCAHGHASARCDGGSNE